MRLKKNKKRNPLNAFKIGKEKPKQCHLRDVIKSIYIVHTVNFDLLFPIITFLLLNETLRIVTRQFKKQFPGGEFDDFGNLEAQSSNFARSV